MSGGYGDRFVFVDIILLFAQLNKTLVFVFVLYFVLLFHTAAFFSWICLKGLHASHPPSRGSIANFFSLERSCLLSSLNNVLCAPPRVGGNCIILWAKLQPAALIQLH